MIMTNRRMTSRIPCWQDVTIMASPLIMNWDYKGHSSCTQWNWTLGTFHQVCLWYNDPFLDKKKTELYNEKLELWRIMTYICTMLRWRDVSWNLITEWFELSTASWPSLSLIIQILCPARIKGAMYSIRVLLCMNHTPYGIDRSSPEHKTAVGTACWGEKRWSESTDE